MRRVVAVIGIASVIGGCRAEPVRESPGTSTRRAIWRLRQQLPEDAAREDLLNLSHALEQFWFAVADANPSQRSAERSARPPDWSCDNCGRMRAGTFDQPSGAPDGVCPRCREPEFGAEPIHRLARRGIQGRYPTRDEGLRTIGPFLRGDPPAPDFIDPWGRPYIYVPYDDSGFGVGAVPRGKYLLYSTGANRRDEGGGGDDISNLPEVFVPPIPPAPAPLPAPRGPRTVSPPSGS